MAEVASSCADTLSDKCCGSVADAVARHVAEAFGCDSKGIGSDGDIAQRSYNHCAYHLRTVHQNVLQGHRSADLESFLHVGSVPDKPLKVFFPCEDLAFHHSEIDEGQRRNDIGKSSADSCTGHAESESEDVEVGSKDTDCA